MGLVLLYKSNYGANSQDPWGEKLTSKINDLKLALKNHEIKDCQVSKKQDKNCPLQPLYRINDLSEKFHENSNRISILILFTYTFYY